MSEHLHLMTPGKQAWQVLSSASTATPTDLLSFESDSNDDVRLLPANLEQWLTENPGRIVIGLDSNDCLCASIDINALPRRNRREAMAYRLEDKIPLPAEDLITRFHVVNDTALGVAVREDALQPILENLESLNHPVEYVVPLALLALQRYLSENKIATPDVVLWQTDHRHEIFIIKNRVICYWMTLPLCAKQLTRQLETIAIEHCDPLRLVACNIDDATQQQLKQLPDVTLIETTDDALLHDAYAMADQLVRGKAKPWINLHPQTNSASAFTTRLGRSLPWFVAACMIFLVTLTGVMFWRGQQFNQVAIEANHQERQLFKSLFPNQATPANVRSRLLSEHRQLIITGDDTEAAGQSTSAAVILQHALSTLPEDLRYRIVELRIDRQRFEILGETRNHSDAEALAEFLRSLERWTVATPKTRLTTSGHIAFSITAKLNTTTRLAKGASR